MLFRRLISGAFTYDAPVPLDVTMTRRRTSLAYLTLCLLMVVSTGHVWAQQKVLTPELILTIRQVTDAQISPDGSRIVFQVMRPRAADEKPGGAIPELWLVPAGGGGLPGDG